MPKLYAVHPLGSRKPLREDLPGIAVEEISGRSLVSIAARLGAEGRLREAVLEAFSLDLPAPGRIAAGPRVSFAWMANGQWFVDAAGRDAPDLDVELARVVGGSASLTDQSDAWMRLRLTGPNVRGALERLTMLDLDESRFPPRSAARTVMEHIGAAILRPDVSSFELWSARSSARSFAHAIRTAASHLPA